jgi:hypothetical protein
MNARTTTSRTDLRRRFTLALAATVGVAGLGLGLTACGDDEPADTGAITTETSTDAAVDDDADASTQTISADEGAAARQARDAALGRGGTEAASLTVAAGDEMPIECGIGGEPYVPSAEEIAAANADTDALAAVLDTYGITYERIADELGFAYLQWDNADIVAQSVSDSFWHDRYPPEPIPAEELDRIRTENDGLAAALDAAGVTYTRQTDDAGWESVVWDYEDPAAQAAVDAYYAVLYPPIPPSPEDLERMQSENDALAAAFDAAGIAYTRMADEVGWEWIEWDWENQAANDAAQAVYAELYPMPEGGPDLCAMPMPLPAIEGDVSVGSTDSVMPGDAGVADDAATGEIAEAPAGDREIAIESEIGILPVEDVFTPDQVAQRAAEVQAMADGFTAAGVEHEVTGEAPWASVLFDIDAAAAPGVIAEILAQRG